MDYPRTSPGLVGIWYIYESKSGSSHLLIDSEDEQPPEPETKQTPAVQLGAPVESTAEYEQYDDGTSSPDEQKSPEKKTSRVGASLVGKKNQTGPVLTSYGRITS